MPKDCKGRKTTKSLQTRSNFCLLVQFWSNYVSALKGEEDLRAPEEPTTRIMWVLSSYEIPVLYWTNSLEFWHLCSVHRVEAGSALSKIDFWLRSSTSPTPIPSPIDQCFHHCESLLTGPGGSEAEPGTSDFYLCQLFIESWGEGWCPGWVVTGCSSGTGWQAPGPRCSCSSCSPSTTASRTPCDQTTNLVWTLTPSDGKKKKFKEMRVGDPDVNTLD